MLGLFFMQAVAPAITVERNRGGRFGIETLSTALTEPRYAEEKLSSPDFLQKVFVGRIPRKRLLAIWDFARRQVSYRCSAVYLIRGRDDVLTGETQCDGERTDDGGNGEASIG